MPGEGCRALIPGEGRRLDDGAVVEDTVEEALVLGVVPEDDERSPAVADGRGVVRRQERRRASVFTPLASEPHRVYPDGCSSGYVTGLPIDTARCVVVEVDLRGNNLTGPLNIASIMHLLHWVQVLRLDDNAISGALPVQLFTSLPWLHTLGLAGNQFTYEATPEEVLTRCSPAVTDDDLAPALISGMPALPPPPFDQPPPRAPPTFPPTPPRTPLQCIGLPGESCDAFGADGAEFRVAVDVARSCVRCEGGGFAAFALFVLPSACLAVSIFYTLLIVRDASRIRTWVPRSRCFSST